MSNEPVDTASKGRRHGAKIMDNFRYARSAILEAIHVLLRINTSTVVKKGNETQKKTKVSP